MGKNRNKSKPATKAEPVVSHKSSKVSKKSEEPHHKAPKSAEKADHFELADKEISILKTDSETVKEKKEIAKLYQKSRKEVGLKIKEAIERKQVMMAVKELVEFNKRGLKNKKLLDDEEDFVYVNFTLSQVPQKASPKPHLIQLQNPIYTQELKSKVCMIVKDPARDFKDQIQDMDLPCIAKVMGFEKVRKEFKQFKDKRALIKEYDMFAADLRVYKMLPAVLGREFYKGKQFPVPLKIHDMEGKALENQLNSLAGSTPFMMGNGPNYSLRVGRTTQSPKEVAQNVEAALIQALPYVLMHDNIKFSKI
jgi:hypothetical protein